MSVAVILINFITLCKHIYVISICVRPKTKVKLEEEMLRSLPEQINFISMNLRAQCFLVAHFTRQEANFKWSGPHGPAVHVGEREEERERERERDQHLQSPEDSREGKDAAGSMTKREIHEERDRSCVHFWLGGGRGTEGGAKGCESTTSMFIRPRATCASVFVCV